MSAASEAFERIVPLIDDIMGVMDEDIETVRKALHEPEVLDPGPRGNVGVRGPAGPQGPSGIKIEMTPEGAAKMNEALAKFVTRPRWWQR